MNASVKIIFLVLGTFLITFLTSLLLELPLFKAVERRILIDLLLLIELYFAFIIYKYLLQNKIG